MPLQNRRHNRRLSLPKPSLTERLLQLPENLRGHKPQQLPGILRERGEPGPGLSEPETAVLLSGHFLLHEFVGNIKGLKGHV